MYSFIVLGLVPGSNFQITFQLWLATLAAVVAAFGFYLIRHQLVADFRKLAKAFKRLPLETDQSSVVSAGTID